ncbi:hypothetical protein V6N13_087528 [Hibiscus sabdariffa]
MESCANIGEAAIIPPRLSRFFSEIWGVRLPNKLKITMWRIVHNFLPTFDNLQAQRLIVNNHCPLCENDCEYVEHIMKDCSFVRELLHAQGINFADQPFANSWKDWLVQTFLNLGLIHKKAIIVTFSAVWYARNKLVHEGLKMVIANTLSFILVSLKESEMSLDRASPSPPLDQAKWIAPPTDVVKLVFHVVLAVGLKLYCPSFVGSESSSPLLFGIVFLQ